jgi:UDP-N-acetylglucosamine 2-epimerase (non-hydrolysing)
MKKILIVVGTRPNFIKITLFKKLEKAFRNLEIKIVHTGQHFDDKMADVFFRQLHITPDYFLSIPQGSAVTQMAEIMLRLERLILSDYNPNLMLVVGDVNSTLAAALAANKMGIPIGHIESGLRSDDLSMPEEINRILTDNITDYFFITEKSGFNNLVKQGVDQRRLFLVGNTMIDTLVNFEDEIKNIEIEKTFGLKSKNFVLMTMHRPATVDNLSGLTKLLHLIELITLKYDLIFPVHPRTLNNLAKFGLLEKFNSNTRIKQTEPLDYFSFQALIKECKFIITDSGGIQEESTFMRIPCITLRPNTERPITCEVGSNTLAPFEMETILEIIKDIECETYKKGVIPDLWDGQSTKRILEIISEL